MQSALAQKLKPTARRIILPTLYQRQSLYDYHLKLLADTYPDYLAAAVPHCAAVREAVAQGKTIWEYEDRHSRTLPAVRNAYEQLTASITQQAPALVDLAPGAEGEETRE